MQHFIRPTKWRSINDENTRQRTIYFRFRHFGRGTSRRLSFDSCHARFSVDSLSNKKAAITRFSDQREDDWPSALQQDQRNFTENFSEG